MTLPSKGEFHSSLLSSRREGRKERGRGEREGRKETEIERTPITQNDCHLEREGGKSVQVSGGGELEVQEQTGRNRRKYFLLYSMFTTVGIMRSIF